jgi:hypothetical protein
VRTKVYEDYIRDNVVSWFECSKNNGLPVERMEDLILVTGCTMVTSWAAATFVDHSQEISLAAQALPSGGAQFNWSRMRGNVPHHDSQHDSDSAVRVSLAVFPLAMHSFLFCLDNR